jgi:hypothetical protein
MEGKAIRAKAVARVCDIYFLVFITRSKYVIIIFVDG